MFDTENPDLGPGNVFSFWKLYSERTIILLLVLARQEKSNYPVKDKNK